MKYSVLLFDLDQTLFDTDKNAGNALRKMKLPFEFDFDESRVEHWHETQRQMWGELELGQMTQTTLIETRFQRYFDFYGIKVDSSKLEQQFEQLFFAEHELMPHAKDLLLNLHLNYKLVVISNSSPVKQKRLLHDAQIEDLFDEVFLAPEIGYSKPDVKFFKEVEQNLNCQRSEMLVIGDSLSADILGANNFGIDSIWFNRYQSPNSTVEPTYEVNDLKEIIDILN